MRFIVFLIIWMSVLAGSARADFIITSAILEFTKNGPTQQDIELISRSKESDYIVAEVHEVVNPGTPAEERVTVSDPTKSLLLVTPNKTILPAGGRKIIRFVLMGAVDDREHIFRVAIKPVVKGIENTGKVGLKILIGYEVLVIVRPENMQPAYNASRLGGEFTATNTGNTNILFQNGKQCRDVEKCVLAPVVRIYPGDSETVALPYDKPVSYSIWDGQGVIEKDFE